MSTPVECTLVGLFPTAQQLPAPAAGKSYIVFEASGFSESGIHAFLGLVPALGVAMARSNISMGKAEALGSLAAQLANDIGVKAPVGAYIGLLPAIFALGSAQ